MIHQGTIYQGTDGTRPSFLNWPSNINGTIPFSSSPTTVSWTEPIGVASVAASQSSGSFVVVGYTNVVYTATDPSGNFESCSFSVTVTGTIYPGTDGTRPSFLNWPSNINGTVPFGSSPTTVSWTEPIGVASVAAPQSSGSFFVVEYTNMPKIYNTAPVLSNCPSDQTVFASQNAQGAVATWSALTATDNSDDVMSITSDFSSETLFPGGVTTVTFTATDSSCNMDTCQFSVSVLVHN
ncbi:hyalin-like isoform X4 [Strongylocentrotus purpuratus]|uniref:HYR domain-containing protein n=1 Tax=Strongylocentrotus purpuratus TaxID=7668 RepID=A0A7M7PLI7_STRPU|nr:hyalin-like isoform X4 [Strongylocentrotus purpuratus]